MPSELLSGHAVRRNPDLDVNQTEEAGSQLVGEREALADAFSDSASPQSIIGRALRIAGNVVAEGTLQLDGIIEGDVQCEALKVGEFGHVMGGIIAEDVTVDGRVGGDIRGESVTLQSHARVKGEIHHARLAIEQGALFDGRSCPSNTPTELDKRGDGGANAREREPDGQFRGSGDGMA